MRFGPTAGTGFHAVLRGTCWLIPGQGGPIRLSAGDVVFLRGPGGHVLADSPSPCSADVRSGPRGRLAVARDDEPDRTVMLCGARDLGNRRPAPPPAELPDIRHVPAERGHGSPLGSAIALLGSELERQAAGHPESVPGLLDLLLRYIVEAGFDERRARVDGVPVEVRDDPAVREALLEIHADPARAWSVAELGMRAGLSRAAFARRFTTIVGEPPMTYLTRWRMRMAEQLLRESEASVGAVAKQTGYTSEFAFAKAFKRRYGISPGAYRQQPRP